ncbi:MFS transporter [Isobaculum melis]|uniref:MFS transporter, UMF1 family n=1 Tax=Isobaculum melis TaxID=142588 RepID=A0A1H9TGG2_9LACT|nr:MFS transporter [Isobaculum melis]SER96218.1 MFS transporter, UMF1 family [Isobaculum melis]
MDEIKEKKKPFKYTKLEKSWILQDWANSAYSIMITTAVFPLFFKAITESNGISDASSTAWWGYVNALSTLIVSVLAPLLGTLADYKGYRNPLFTLATMLGVIATLLFAFVPDDSWQLLLILYTLSSVGFAASNIFYDASLVDATTSERMDRVSSSGFGWGYIGSTIPFMIFIFFQLTGILPISTGLLTKYAFILTALWWFIFTIPYWKNVKQKTYIEKPPHVVAHSFKRLWQTLKHIRQYRNVFLFLLGYFFYIDGVGTIFTMATTFGTDIGISANNLIVIMLIVQFVAFPFSILYGVLAKHFGNKRMIFIGILTYVGICLFAIQMDSMLKFIILAVLVGTAQGGIQSLSRSLFAQIIPQESSNEFFGFYNIFGKFAAVMGPLIVGIITSVTGHSTDGVFALIILFIVGGIFLHFVDSTPIEQKK